MNEDLRNSIRMPARPGKCTSHGVHCMYDNSEDDHRCQSTECTRVILIPKTQYVLWAANRIKGVPF